MSGPCAHIWELPLRGQDAYGAGHYGAPRGRRKHFGVDLAVDPGTILLAPATLEFSKLGYPYADDLGYRYVELYDFRGHTYHRFFYLAPSPRVATLHRGDVLKADRAIGEVQDLRRRYPEDSHHPDPITSHVHYEVKDRRGNYLDPTAYLSFSAWGH